MKKFIILIILSFFTTLVQVEALTFTDDGATYDLEEVDTSCLSYYADVELYGAIEDYFIFSDIYDEEFIKVSKYEYCSSLYLDDISILRDRKHYHVKKNSDDTYGLYEVKYQSARNYKLQTSEGVSNISLIHYNKSTIDNNLVYYRRTSGTNVEVVPTNELSKYDVLYYYIEAPTVDFEGGTYIKEVSNKFYDLSQKEHSLTYNAKTNNVYITVVEDNVNNVYDSEGNLLFADIERFEPTSNGLFLVYSDGTTKIYNADKKLLKKTNMLISSYEVSEYYDDILLIGTDAEGDNRIPYKIDSYKIIEGKNQTYQNEDLKISINRSVWEVSKILINDRILFDHEYEVDGPTDTITISKDYLDTLSNGEYTITIQFENYVKLETTLKITNSTVSKKLIKEVIITNFTAPIIGTAPTFTSKVGKNAKYVITSQSWEDKDHKYKYYPENKNHNDLKVFEDKEYLYTVYIEVENGYTIDDSTKFYLDGNLMEFRQIKENVYAAEYGFVPAREAQVKITNVTMPDVGKKPVYTGKLSAHLFRINKEAWYDSEGNVVSGKFKIGEEYTYRVYVEYMSSSGLPYLYATVNNRPMRYEGRDNYYYVFSYTVKLDGVPDTSDNIVSNVLLCFTSLIALICIVAHLRNKRKIFN